MFQWRKYWTYSKLDFFQVVCGAVFLNMGFCVMWLAQSRVNGMIAYAYGLILVGMGIMLASFTLFPKEPKDISITVSPLKK